VVGEPRKKKDSCGGLRLRAMMPTNKSISVVVWMRGPSRGEELINYLVPILSAYSSHPLRYESFEGSLGRPQSESPQQTLAATSISVAEFNPWS
jgi:hypothetical protein